VKRLVALVAAIGLVIAPAARADGDPASDVLLSQDSFLPYAPPVTARLKTALEKVLKDARAAGYPMKVALIMSEADLGAYPKLFNQPQPYANLLSGELASLNPHGDPQRNVHLLVVMPGGFGGTNLGDGVDAALRPVTINVKAQSDGLAQAAIAAVARIASSNGHRVPVPPEASLELKASSKSTKRSGTSPLVFALPALLLFAGLFVAGRVQRRRLGSGGDG
jgi:hypothetical protein